MVCMSLGMGVGCSLMSLRRSLINKRLSHSPTYSLYLGLRGFMFFYREPEAILPWVDGLWLRSRLSLVFISSMLVSASLYTYFVWVVLDVHYIPYVFLVFPFSYLVSQLALNIYLWGLENDFYSSLGMEYPVFLLIFAISSGVNIYNFFHIVVDRFRGILRATSRLLGKWIIDYELSESSLDDIIFESLERLKDVGFKFFIRDLIRVRAYSGEVDKFIENSLDKLYMDISVNWEDSWRSTVGRLEMIILLFGLLPAIVMSVISIAPSSLVSNTFLVLAVVIPVVGYTTHLYLDRSLYKIPIEVGPLFSRLPLSLSVASALFSYYILDRLINLSIGFYVKVSISLAVMLLYPSIVSLVGWFGERDVDRDLANFLFNVEDMMRNGFSIREAISRIELSGYSNIFRNLAGRIKYYFEYGEGGSLSPSKGFSRLALLTTVLIPYISDIGGGLREVIFLRRMGEQYLRMKSRKASYSLFPLLTAVFVVFLALYNFWILRGIFMGVDAQAFPAYMGLLGALEWLSTLYKTIILESILVSGVLISKVIHNNVYHTYPILILLISYIVGLALFPF